MMGNPQVTPLPDQNSLAEHNTRLVAKNAQLRSVLAFADAEVRALTVFASRNDNALWNRSVGTLPV